MRAKSVGRIPRAAVGEPRRRSVYERELRPLLERERERLRSLVGALAAAERALAESQGEEGDYGGDQADLASDLSEGELDVGLERAERRRLADVEDALMRLDAGSYGRCERCGEMILLGRLRALPWTRVCIGCAMAAGAASARGAIGLPQ